MNNKPAHGNTGKRNAAKLPEEKKPRTKYVTISIHPDQAAKWRVMAENAGMSLAQWVVSICNKQM
jgi:hypothetical protein